MFTRRHFLGTIPATAIATSSLTAPATSRAQAVAPEQVGAVRQLIGSPPVVQHPRYRDGKAIGFGVSIAVGQLATAWVEYGWASDQLRYTAHASHHGLIQANERALSISVEFVEPVPADQLIYYRVVVQPLQYQNAYSVKRGEAETTPVYRLRLPNSNSQKQRVVVVNDTHENLTTIQLLHRAVDDLAPDLLVWNGDTCNDFDRSDSPAQITLNPAKDVHQAWACERPMVFCCGNHDVRGERARELTECLSGCPEQPALPYNQALRLGPLALITLDTGEDKPDAHPVFAGTAAYEPYRERQATWLEQVLDRPDIKEAPIKIVACHIPLRGQPGDPDGMSLDAAAHYCGFAAKLWLPRLKEAGVLAVLSGHMHKDRVDDQTPEMPVLQFVGGGPKPDQATLTIVDVAEDAGEATYDIRIVDVKQKLLHQRRGSLRRSNG